MQAKFADRRQNLILPCRFFSHPHYGSDKTGKCKLTRFDNVKNLSSTVRKVGSIAAGVRQNPKTTWPACDVKDNMANTVKEYKGPSDKKEKEKGKNNCYIEKGKRAVYNGDISKTKSGKTCQRWDKHKPHNHSYSGHHVHGGGYLGSSGHRYHDSELGITNYNGEAICADPDNSKGPWCYTTDPKKRWEYCNNYGDTQTKNGRRCQQWHHHSPHEHGQWGRRGKYHNDKKGNISHNKCRDPDESGYPWCYTTSSGKRWEYCDVPECDLDKIGKDIKINAIDGVGDCTNHRTGQYLGKDLTKEKCAARCKARNAKYMTHGRKKGNTSAPCTKKDDKCRCSCSTTCSNDTHSAYRAYEVS